MAQLHDDPFDRKRLAEEAAQEKKAFESRLAAEEDAKKKLARQNLEREKQELVRSKANKEGELQQLRSRITQNKSKELTAEGTERVTRSKLSRHKSNVSVEKQKNDLMKKIADGEREVSRLTLALHATVEEPKTSTASITGKKLASLQSDLERVTREHNSVADEVKKLTATLEEAEEKVKRLEQEKNKTTAEITRVTTDDQKAVAQTRAKEILNKKAIEKQKEEQIELDKLNKNIQNLKIELQQVENQLILETREEEGDRGELEKAGEELKKDRKIIIDLELNERSLSEGISQIESKIREIDTKLSQLR